MFKVNVFAWALLVVMSGGTVGAQADGRGPVAWADENSRLAHTELLAKARRGGIDVYFEGDSITGRAARDAFDADVREIDGRIGCR